jgi:hypothetical protein
MKNKGDLMKLVYSKEELNKIDSAIPMSCWEVNSPLYHVMNYNRMSAFGEIENMFDIAKIRGIDVSEFEKFKEKKNG